MPSLFIITGSNGAGKSTVGYSYLPDVIQETYKVFDGDKEFMTMHRQLLKTIRSSKEARKIAEEWLHDHFEKLYKNAIKQKDHFAYEGHFTSDESWKLPRKFKRKGYVIEVIFFGLANPDQSELRVMKRSIEGGHNVSRPEIEFCRQPRIPNKNYRIIDDLKIFDTSGLKHKLLFHRKNKTLVSYTPSIQLPEWFINGLPKLATLIIKYEKRSDGFLTPNSLPPPVQ